MAKPTQEELFALIPEIPEEFKTYCYSLLPKVPIYYRRHGKLADCTCGNCGKTYVTKEIPVRGERAVCLICSNDGFWEWQRITKSTYDGYDVVLTQCAEDQTLILRVFTIGQRYKQGCKAWKELREVKRIFLRLGDAWWFKNEYCYENGDCRREWSRGKGAEPAGLSNLYGDWEAVIKRSCLKYCDVDAIRYTAGSVYGVTETLIAFANNPAMEMYSKQGMGRLVGFLIQKEGKTELVKRRKKTVQEQLQLHDRRKIKRLAEQKGDIWLLKILQKEEKLGQNWNEEQELFLKNVYSWYTGEKQTDYLLRYMSLQQLMNRVKKYKAQKDYKTDASVIGAYYDYLKIRQELEYDMTNEVYLYPKNLKQKHDQMVKEREEHRDELHAKKMKKKYPDIAKRYKALEKRYSFADETYLIRPAKSAEEIVQEGRLQHHCVGGEGYLGSHNNGRTYILLLRKRENPDQPYYTIEIRENEILQWYGAYDKKPDRATIEAWLNAYTEHLKKKRLRTAG